MRRLRRCPVYLAAGLAVTSTLMLHSPALARASHNDGTHSANDVAALVADLAEANERIARIGADIQQRQEGVNRALVDVVDARDDVESARLEVEASQRTLADANTAITMAQKRFDEFAVSTYVNGPSASYLTPGGVEDLLATAGAEQTLAAAADRALTDLRRARVEQTNRASMARNAQQRAEHAAMEAQRSQDAAVAALTEAQQQFGAQQAEVNRLATERTAAQTRLEAAHPVATATPNAVIGASATGVPSTDGQWDGRSAGSPPKAGGASQWDTTLPMVPSANVASDPVAIVNAVLQISSTSVQLTADMGRRFLTTIGLLPEPVAAADPGITNGRIPRVYGRQASEFVIRRAMSQMGVPYSWGGGNANGPSRGIDQGANTVGFDCSGLMLYAFAGVGIKLDHYSGSQYDAGRKIPSAQMRRGDLIFYGPNASQHEAMYLGEGMMLEAPYTGSQVKVSPVRTSGMTPYVTRLIDY